MIQKYFEGEIQKIVSGICRRNANMREKYSLEAYKLILVLKIAFLSWTRNCHNETGFYPGR